jgi:hypothetical protein
MNAKALAAFRAASEKGDLRAQVRIAGEMARHMVVADGIEQERMDAFNKLAGGKFEHAASSVEVWSSYCDHISAAYALGIAVGQLVHPDVFKTGGER